MHLFPVTSGTKKSRSWLIRGVLAMALLSPALAQAKADPRIDQDTTPIRAQQISTLRKSPARISANCGCRPRTHRSRFEPTPLIALMNRSPGAAIELGEAAPAVPRPHHAAGFSTTIASP